MKTLLLIASAMLPAGCATSGAPAAANREGMQPPPLLIEPLASSGATDLHALVMFVVDATKPFSSPTTFEEH